MKTDIIILSKTQALLSKALASLDKNVDPSSIGKIVVGWTGDGMPELPSLKAAAEVVKLEKYNFAENNNTIAKNYSTADCLLFLNDDIELVEDSVSKCLKWVKNPTIGTVGIKLLYPDKTIQHAGIFVHIKDNQFKGVSHLHWKQPDKVLPPYEVIGSTGAFLMMRREVFNEVGGFNTSYKHCFEDVELNIMVGKLGLHNICDNSTWAWHAESQTRKQMMCEDDIVRLANLVDNMQKEKPQKAFKHCRFAICTIASPLEANYLDEWIAYHRAIGVEQFFIATNDWDWKCNLDYVCTTRINGRNKQCQYYTNFARTMAGIADWCAFIDVDEFIKLGSKQKTVLDLVHDNNCVDSIALSWKLFGSNGKHFDGEYSVLKRFIKCQDGFNKHIKTILNLKKLKSFGDDKALFFPTPHYALSTKTYGVGQWSVDGRQIHGPCDNDSYMLKSTDACLAHFFCKTPEEWKLKQQRGRVDVPEESSLLYRKDEEFAAHDYNEVECTQLRDLLYKKR